MFNREKKLVEPRGGILIDVTIPTHQFHVGIILVIKFTLVRTEFAPFRHYDTPLGCSAYTFHGRLLCLPFYRLCLLGMQGLASFCHV